MNNDAAYIYSLYLSGHHTPYLRQLAETDTKTHHLFFLQILHGYGFWRLNEVLQEFEIFIREEYRIDEL